MSVVRQTTRNALLQQLVTFTRSFHEPYQVQVVVRGEVEVRVSRSVTDVRLQMDIFGNLLGLGLGLITGQKKRACPARGPKQDREILRGCMSRSPYKSQISSEDKVAVLWKSPATRNPKT